MREVAIYGMGKLAKRFYYKFKDRKRVCCWYGTDADCDDLYGLPVKKFEKVSKNELLIVADDNWFDICCNLEIEGGRWIEDFMPVWLFNTKMINWKDWSELSVAQLNLCLNYIKTKKKVAIIHGNCQTDMIQRFLAENVNFISHYIIINIPRVFQANEKTWSLMYESQLFQICDLFVSQKIKSDNKYGKNRSSREIEARLNPFCKVIHIPNIYFDGYFPQIGVNEANVLMDVQEDGLFKWGDKFCDMFIREGISYEEAMKRIESQEILPQSVIFKHIEDSFEELEQRECDLDITISDYIRNNYKKKQLFFAPNHPINEVLIVCTQRILSALEFSTDFSLEIAGMINSLVGEDVPIYPAVLNAIGLTDYFMTFFPNRYIECCSYSFEEYYRLYYSVCEK